MFGDGAHGLAEYGGGSDNGGKTILCRCPMTQCSPPSSWEKFFCSSFVGVLEQHLLIPRPMTSSIPAAIMNAAMNAVMNKMGLEERPMVSGVVLVDNGWFE